MRPAIVTIWAGRHRRDEWTALCDRYLSRIRRRVPIEELPVRAGGRGRARLEAEGKAILAAVPERSYLIALDSRGKQRTSSDLARWLGRRLEGNRRPLVFVVGSDLGIAADLLERANETLSFGAMTLPHELARVVLYEQLYRGLSILGGMKYHREPL
ncbi:MAG: 23S rRNA (pseudouridine(1915)-N(3))-methyltransferase RlmH [bacterium]|nr:23S rRNA (pseudouridine(1915)-N(3))-methyltransferase RlmH [bacterium]